MTTLNSVDGNSLDEACLPPLGCVGTFKRFTIQSIAEMAPRYDSRVALSEKRDQFGQRQINLVLSFSETERESHQKSLKLIGAILAQSGVGRLKITMNSPELWQHSEAHHMGTTRMHSSPTKGVVDENLKVHGINNLFVASSAVFPTGGFSNPTMTIVALSLRLEDHLKKVLGDL